MTLVVDIELNVFKSLPVRDSVSFLYIETNEAWVFLKPFSDLVYRTVIYKTTEEEDESFRLRELYKTEAVPCLNFVVDGVALTEIVKQVSPTKGEVNLNEEQEESEESEVE